MAEEQQSLESGRLHQYESHGGGDDYHNEGDLEGETDYSDDDRTLFVGDVPRTVTEVTNGVLFYLLIFLLLL